MQASHCNGFSCCGARALGTQASVVMACGLSSCGLRALERRLSSCASQAELLRGMWDLPRPGLKPVSPVLAGGFLTTVPPGKPAAELLNWSLTSLHLSSRTFYSDKPGPGLALGWAVCGCSHLVTHLEQMKWLVQKKQISTNSTLGWEGLDPIHPQHQLSIKAHTLDIYTKRGLGIPAGSRRRLLCAEMMTDSVTVVLGHIHMLVPLISPRCQSLMTAPDAYPFLLSHRDKACKPERGPWPSWHLPTSPAARCGQVPKSWPPSRVDVWCATPMLCS